MTSSQESPIPVKIPKAVIVGFPKCGTSALFSNLSRHPQVQAYRDKHCCFDFPREDSPLICRDRSEGEAKGILKREAFVFDKQKMRQIASFDPKMKLLICLRYPIQYLHSHYAHRVSVFRESNMPWGIDPAKKTLADIVLRGQSHGAVAVERGFYMHWLQENVLPYFKHEQICFIIQEQMAADIDGQMKRVFDFLKIEKLSLVWKSYQSFDENNRYPDIDYESSEYARLSQVLLKTYEPYNRALYQFLGYEIPEWRAVDSFYRMFADKIAVNVM